MISKSKTIIFDGKKAAQEILSELKKEIAKQAKKPGLAAILVGDDKPSHIYIRNKEKASHYCNISFHKYLFGKDISERELLDCILFLNRDSDVDGIIVQLPLPEKFDVNKIIATIDSKKDADGFHPQTIKDIMAGQPAINSALIQAIREILKQTKQDLSEKKLVLVSNCDIFYSTFVKELEDLNLEIEVVLSSDKKLSAKTKQADILVAALGQPEFITKDMVKAGAIVIDVGTTIINEKFVGDVDFKQVKKVASFITPVPGGVGPMTVAMLLKNVYQLAKKNKSL